MKNAWLALGLMLVLTQAIFAQEEAENITSILANYLSPNELGIEQVTPDKLVVNRVGEAVKSYSFSTIEDVQKASDGQRQEALKQRLELYKKDLNEKKLVSLAVSQQTDIYDISTIYANINKKAFRTRIRITLTAPDNYKSVRIVQTYPSDEDISVDDFVFKPEDKPVVFKTRDPVLEWNLPLVSPGQVIKLEYFIKDIITNANINVLAFGEPYNTPLPEAEIETAAENETPTNITNSTGNENVKNFSTKQKFSTAFLLTILSIITLVSIVVAIFHYELKEKAVSEKRKHSENLDRYVKTSLQMGADPKTLRQALTTAGWDQQTVDKLIEHHAKKH